MKRIIILCTVLLIGSKIMAQNVWEERYVLTSNLLKKSGFTVFAKPTKANTFRIYTQDSDALKAIKQKANSENISIKEIVAASTPQKDYAFVDILEKFNIQLPLKPHTINNTKDEAQVVKSKQINTIIDDLNKMDLIALKNLVHSATDLKDKLINFNVIDNETTKLLKLVAQKNKIGQVAYYEMENNLLLAPTQENEWIKIGSDFSPDQKLLFAIEDINKSNDTITVNTGYYRLQQEEGTGLVVRKFDDRNPNISRSNAQNHIYYFVRSWDAHPYYIRKSDFSKKLIENGINFQREEKYKLRYRNNVLSTFSVPYALNFSEDSLINGIRRQTLSISVAYLFNSGYKYIKNARFYKSSTISIGKGFHLGFGNYKGSTNATSVSSINYGIAGSIHVQGINLVLAPARVSTLSKDVKASYYTIGLGVGVNLNGLVAPGK